MADFVEIPTGDTRSIRGKRRAVKILMMAHVQEVCRLTSEAMKAG
jgi:hypothetical protein